MTTQMPYQGSVPIRYDPPNKNDDGSWFCDEGPYLDRVRRDCMRRPNLRLPDSRNRAINFRSRAASTTVLAFSDGCEPLRTDLSDAKKLQQHFKQVHQNESEHSPQRRVYLQEGINPEFISVLGQELNVEPMFFVDHERTSHTLGWFNECNLAPQLPSSMDSSTSFTCSYYDLRATEPSLETFRAACADTGRDALTHRLRGEWQPTVVIHQKCSVWVDKRSEESWNSEFKTPSTVNDDQLASIDELIHLKS